VTAIKMFNVTSQQFVQGRLLNISRSNIRFYVLSIRESNADNINIDMHTMWPDISVRPNAGASVYVGEGDTEGQGPRVTSGEPTVGYILRNRPSTWPTAEDCLRRSLVAV